MPGTVLSASAKVVALVCLMSSSGITVTERGVSSSGAVNLYEGSVFVCISDGAALTTTAGRVVSPGVSAKSALSVAAVWATACAGAKKLAQ